MSGPLGFGACATLVLPDGETRHATLFHARYDGLQPIQCLEGVQITFVDPSRLETLLVYPGQKELILETLHRYQEGML